MKESPWIVVQQVWKVISPDCKESRLLKKREKAEERTEKGNGGEGRRGKCRGGGDGGGVGSELIRFLDVFNHVENSTVLSFIILWASLGKTDRNLEN